MKHIWYLPIKSKFSFYFIQYTGIFLFTKQAVKMQKPNFFENTNNFGTTLFPNVKENEYPHFMFSFVNNGVIDI